MGNLLAELRRRNMFRVAGVYAVASWLLAQMAAVLENSMNLPGWFDTVVVSLLLLSFPIALILAWAFEMTPEGVKRTESVSREESITHQTGRKLDYAIIGGLALVAALMIGPSVLPGTNAKLTEAETSAEAREESIAVLQFADFSPDADQEYFARGISEELLNVLARIDGLRVSSRTSSFAFKDKDTSIAEIGEALNVAHVLEGSVRKSGNTLRITAQLIDTKTDVHLWSETYDRPLTADNIFEVQDDIATEITRELRGQMGFTLDPGLIARTTSVEAYQTFLRARESLQKRLPDTLEAAVDGFQEVIKTDPNYAPAYAGLAESYLLMNQHAGKELDEMIKLAEPHVNKALELAPDSAEALTASALLAGQYAIVAFNNSDLEKGSALTNDIIELADKAIAANPNYAQAYHRKGMALNLDRPEEALATFKKGLELDPLSGVLLSNIAANQLRLGDIEGSRETAEQLIRWNPDEPFGYSHLAQLAASNGDYSAAHQYYKDAEVRNPTKAQIRNGIITIYVMLGMSDILENLDPPPAQKVFGYIVAGDREKARENLDQVQGPARAFLLFMLRDHKQASEFSAPFFDFIYTEDWKATSTNIYDLAQFGYFLKEGESEHAASAVTRLNAYFQDKAPTDFTTLDEIHTGALWEIISDKPEAALRWMEHAAARGSSGADLVLSPVFDDVRDRPEFAELKALFEKRMAVHKAAVYDQLANPKPEWILPKTEAKEDE